MLGVLVRLVWLWGYYLQDIGDMLVLVVVAETGGGAAQLSDPSPAWQPLVDQGQLTRPHLVSNHNTNTSTSTLCPGHRAGEPPV